MWGFFYLKKWPHTYICNLIKGWEVLTVFILTKSNKHSYPFLFIHAILNTSSESWIKVAFMTSLFESIKSSQVY